MTGQQIVNMCAAIIKRQDLNIDLLLMFINQMRRTVLRENYLYRIQEWRRNLEPEDGFLRTPSLKQARFVEYDPSPQDNIAASSVKRRKLFPLNTLQDAYDIYDNVDVAGVPMYYIVMQGGLKIIPMPTVGVINVYGEWYPPDIANDSTEDPLSKEISDITIYLACAEYFDFLDETDKANLWRTKAQVMLEKYNKEIKRQMTDDRDLFARDPFGNCPNINGIPTRRGKVYDVDELTGGTEGVEYNEHGQPIGGD